MPAPRLGLRRRGFTTPAVAVALLVTMAGLALILDRLWLDAADLELTTAAEAAALIAASELATDDLLKPAPDAEQRMELARTAAAFIASQNTVGGTPVMLDSTAQGDIRFGQLVVDDQAGQVQFLESSTNPNTVVVTALRSRRSSNPVALFVSGATGEPYGDVATRVEATIDNRICGVRPNDGTPVPAIPIAIWWKDPAGLRVDTWQAQIESRRGADQYGYDPIAHTVYSGSDGIPEIVLRSQQTGQPAANTNLVVVDVGAGMNDQTLARQFASGWTTDDLSGLGGELCLTPATPATMRASAELRHADRQALDSLIGEPRICLLYSAATPVNNGQQLQATCIYLVAIRVLAVRDQGDGSCELTAQPCVLKTKTAILNMALPYSTETVVPVSPYSVAPASGSTGSTATPSGPNGSAGPGNPYIYKLQLSQ
ncbi:MAG: hypothetical protein JSS49_12370 [Planctomycetes bacterium]|nr:hypothetical protein [Planctomycetota bacterium]